MLNFFNEDDRRIISLKHKIKPILALEDKFASMSDDELKAMTPKLKNKIANGAKLDDIYVEAFATAREAAKRVIGLYPYPEQLMGAWAIHHGDIAEMKTGEGKTVTAVMPVYLNALEGKGVHVVTVNEYLSQRDAQLMGQVYNFLGLTVGINIAGLTPEQKREAYNSDITYSTNSELGFDYLRDHMVLSPEDKVQRELNFALIDEADSILLDDSRTPLIISGGEKNNSNLYLQADRLVKMMKEKEDYEIDIRSKTVHLTEIGGKKVENIFKISNLYDPANMELLHSLSQALKANYTMTKDVDYMVDYQNDEILIIDPNTGRTMKGRQWSDGLHQAVEAKEGISIKQETVTQATITYQNYFRLYNKLSGMTGTAKTDEEEFLETYNMFVVPIPTHKPVIRIDYNDVVYGTKKSKYNALIDEAIKRHEKGQPVLIGTIAVETSEVLSKMLDRKGIPHNVLNAKNHAMEADIIAYAGQKGAVTIATNMAGRGTDIKLGEGVKELGGLCILGSERHESRRIDNQLRGRAGRQGDPGETRFYVSVEDDLMKRFGSERLEKMFSSLGDGKVESKTVTKSISSAQERIEGVNYDSRKQLMQYDDIMSQQRNSLYKTRDEILNMSFDSVHQYVYSLFNKVIISIINSNMAVDGKLHPEALKEMFHIVSLNFKDSELDNKSESELVAYCFARAWNNYNEKIDEVYDKAVKVEKYVILKQIDSMWAQHINLMTNLKTGIGLRGYAQTNPLQAYANEGYALFDNMMKNIAFSVVNFCNALNVE